MIRNIVFDMGNVLLDWNPRERLKTMGFSGEHQDILFEEVFHSPEWVLLDAGRIGIPEMEKRVCERMAYHIRKGLYPVPEEEIPELFEEVRYVMDHPADLVLPVEEMQFLPAALKESGYRCYLLTNASVLFRDYQYKIPAFLPLEGIFVSAEHKMLKPDLEIYEALLKEFDLQREETLFIDDNPANISGGIACGIEGIVFTGDVRRLLADLERFGVTVQGGKNE